MKSLGLLFLLIFSATAGAQTATPPPSPSSDNMSTSLTPIAWFTAGPAFSSLSNQSGLVESFRTGLTVGAEYEMPFTSMFSLQVGLDYIQKGEHVDSILATPNHTVDIALNYFEIPVLARVNFPFYKANRFSFLAGPYGAIAVTRNSTDTDNTNILAPVSTTSSISSSTRIYDFGVRLGVALQVPVTDTWMATAGANYDLGLININSAGDSTETHSLQVALGVGMKL